MTTHLLELVQRIMDELSDAERSVNRAQEAWQKFQQSSDDLYIDSAALNLHSFYNGIERLFEIISTIVDGKRPEATDWHQVLLRQMTHEVPEVRPAVISEETRKALDNYRKFRHVVRHIYAFDFNEASLQPIVEAAPDVLARVKAELIAFANFLQHRI